MQDYLYDYFVYYIYIILCATLFTSYKLLQYNLCNVYIMLIVIIIFDD